MAWTDRYVDASASGGGTGTSPADPWTFAEAISNTAAGMRVNFKVGTYDTTTNTNVSSIATTVYQPCWWRGYKTTAGDLDGKLTASPTDATEIPLIRQVGGYMMIQNGFFHLSGLSFTTSINSRPGLYDRRSDSWTKNCRFTNTASNPNQFAAVDTQGSSVGYYNCEFSCSTASSFLIDAGTRYNFINCSFDGSANSGGAASQLTGFYRCLFKNLTTGITMGDTTTITNCIFHNISDDAIISSHIGSRSGSQIANNLFSNVSGYCVGNPSTASTSAQACLLLAGNSFYNSPNKYENIADAPEFDSVAESSDPFTDAAGGDFSLVFGASSYSGGYGLMIGTTSTDYSDIGAIQHQDLTLGGGSSSPTYTSTAGTQMYPFRTFAEDDFDKGGTKFHPLS